jgi:hypothetical protein
MSIPWPYGVTVTLQQISVDGSDAYGNDSLVATERVVPGCVVWPNDSNGSGGNEDTSARDQVLVGYALLMPPGTVVEATDRVVLPNGHTYEVIGEPGEWLSPMTGRQPGVQVALQRITG